jgi:hypothetical protein
MRDNDVARDVAVVIDTSAGATPLITNDAITSRQTSSCQ